jgi:hypothetical protein
MASWDLQLLFGSLVHLRNLNITCMCVATGARTLDLLLRVLSCLCPFGVFVVLILCHSSFEMNIWDPKRIQMKKFSTTKFYNFLRSTTMVLVISQSEVIWRIWISNVRKFNHIFPYINDFKCKSCQLESCITFEDLQLLFWAFLHPRSFEKFKF